MTLDCEDGHILAYKIVLSVSMVIFLWAIFTATYLNIMMNRNILIMNRFFIGKLNLCLFVQSFNDESVPNCWLKNFHIYLDNFVIIFNKHDV